MENKIKKHLYLVIKVGPPFEDEPARFDVEVMSNEEQKKSTQTDPCWHYYNLTEGKKGDEVSGMIEIQELMHKHDFGIFSWMFTYFAEAIFQAGRKHQREHGNG